MTMQRRHYELIAEIIREDKNGMISNDLKTWRPGPAKIAMAHHFARRLRATNPKFDEARFLRACGVDE